MKKATSLFSKLLLASLFVAGPAWAQEQTITMTSAKAAGQTVTLLVNHTRDGVTVDWGDGTAVAYNTGNDVLREVTGVYKGGTITLKGSSKLTTLICAGQELTSLDVSEATNLRSLYCQDNQLTELVVRNIKTLTDLNCANNQIARIQLSSTYLPNLETMNVANNQLGNISNSATATNFVASQPRLQYVNVSGNGKIKTVATSAALKLDYLDCSENSATRVTFSSNEMPITTLLLNDNAISTLDVSNLPRLQQVYVDNNQLQTLDLSAAAELDELSASNNLLDLVSLPRRRIATLYYPNNYLVFSSLPRQAFIAAGNIVVYPQHAFNLPSDMRTSDDGSPYVEVCPSWEDRTNADYVVDFVDKVTDFNGTSRATINFYQVLDDASEQLLSRKTSKDGSGDYVNTSSKISFVKGMKRVVAKVTHTNSSYADYSFVSKPFAVGKDNAVGIDEVSHDAAELTIAVGHGELLLIGGNGRRVSVFEASGKCVWNGVASGNVSVRLPRGIYIVNGKKVLL